MTATTATAAPFEAIPTVGIIDDYERELPRWLAGLALEHGPLFRVAWRDDFVMTYLVGPEANKFVLHTGRQHFSHDLGWSPIIGETLGKGLLTMDGPEHDRHRKMLNPAFTVAYMARYLPIMQRVIAARTREWAERGEVNLLEETRKVTFDVAAEALVGLPPGDEVDRMRQLFYTLLYAPDFDSDAMSWPEYHERRQVAVRDELGGLLLRLIAERRRRPTDDTLGMMVAARDDDGRALDDRQILAHVNILLVAGHETSTTMSAWLLYLLAIHPEYRARVHAELDRLLGAGDGPAPLDAIKAMKVLANALSEAGRLYPPVGNAPRGVVSPFEFAGYRVPAGERVRYSIAAGHWLPTIWRDPGVFDPDRFAPPREEDKKHPYALVPFGGGPRICIGVNFAQVEIKALAAHALRHYTLEPLPGQDIVQLYDPTMAAPWQGIRVKVAERGR
ncbi:MAG TPA: cytochrome P450 [Thermomicrobiales bacterium]|nr:cytochrome P450 [Thermomicrobiales bacterium]